MYLSSHSYPHNQSHLIGIMHKQLDKIFYDVYPVYRPILLPESILKETNVSNNSLKEVFHVEQGGVLRFDHTHGALKYKNLNVNETNFGNVFRREPTSLNRWREFFQYDVDYYYLDHGLRPLKKLRQFLGKEFKILVNDVSLIEELKNSTDEGYIKILLDRYPLLKELDVTIDRSFIRGWNYYTGLIFEISYLDSLSLVGGGLYNNSTIFGFGIGVNRLINLCLKEPSILDRFIPFSSVVWIRYTESIPYNLLDELEKASLDYHLSKVNKTLFKEYKKVNSKLKNVRKKITSIITVSDLEDKNKLYHYHDQKKFSWSLEELSKRLLERAHENQRI